MVKWFIILVLYLFVIILTYEGLSKLLVEGIVDDDPYNRIAALILSVFWPITICLVIVGFFRGRNDRHLED